MKKYFTDDEYRIMLSALSRERAVCEKVDKDDGESTLIRVMSGIEKKIRSLQYPKKTCSDSEGAVKRLTRKWFDTFQGFYRYDTVSNNIELNCGGEDFEKIVDKLGLYEDLEEQELLLKLPCKKGDVIYRFWYADGKPYRIQEQRVRTLSHVVAMMEDEEFGKTVFLSKEEAEESLAKLL